MKSIEEQLADIKKYKKIGLMTHVVIGFPNLSQTYQLVKLMAEVGVDFIELQIPFSDPLADGSTIMKANDQALAQGVKLSDCFKMMKKLSTDVEIPLLFMGYYQSIFHLGVDTFCQKAKAAGAQGLIIPDMPIDEEAYEHFIAICDKYKLHHIRLLSPTSTDDRIRLNATVQNGFVYCTTRAGITGASSSLDASVVSFLKRVKKLIKVPIAVGFGISKSEQVAALVGQANIAVIGSAIIDVIMKKGIEEVPLFIKKLQSQL